MIELYLLHPAAVHFPVAILLLGLAVEGFSHLRPNAQELTRAASGLLWLGTLCAWAAFGLGLLAEETAPHVPPAWETLAEHETLGYWTVGLFSALSLWRLWAVRKGRTTRRWARVFLTVWLLSAGVLVSTAFHGGELVFRFGMGVRR